MIFHLWVWPEEAYGIDFFKKSFPKVGRLFETMPSKIIKIGTFGGLVARHGLIFGENEAHHFQKGF